MLHLLLSLGVFGLFTSTVYGIMVVAGVRYFRRHRPVADGAFTPPVSLLKPLHGAEPNLAEHLEGFFRQDYPAYEILFCARTLNDAGLKIAREVAARNPTVPARFLTSGEPPFANAKVASLDRMAQAAQHAILIVSDSDVRVTPEYLRAVVAPLADEKVGLVTCPYRGVPSSAPPAGSPRSAALWAQLEGAGMSIEMTAGVLVANMLEGMQFALGPTMAVRSACVEEMGGFRALGQYCADDFLLGNLIAANGHRVIFSHHAIDHIVLNTGFVDSIRHQVRWSKSTRFSRPKGHFGTSLTFSMPFALLAFVAALLPALAVGGVYCSRMGHRESHGAGGRCWGCRRPGALAVADHTAVSAARPDGFRLLGGELRQQQDSMARRRVHAGDRRLHAAGASVGCCLPARNRLSASPR